MWWRGEKEVGGRKGDCVSCVIARHRRERRERQMITATKRTMSNSALLVHVRKKERNDEKLRAGSKVRIDSKFDCLATLITLFFWFCSTLWFLPHSTQRTPPGVSRPTSCLFAEGG